MLKIIITFLFITNIPFNLLLAQKSGYENLPWGSTVEEVRKKYPDIESTSDSDPDFKDAVVYIENYSSGSVESREFVFWKNKLLKVKVIYGTDNTTAVGIMDSFTKKFGKWVDSTYAEKETNGITTEIYDFYWINSGTGIILRVFSSEITEVLLTFYISLKYIDEYKDEKSKAFEF